MEKYFGENVPKLGFGLMRLPKKRGGKIDTRQTKQMVDMFMKAGLTFACMNLKKLARMLAERAKRNRNLSDIFIYINRMPKILGINEKWCWI